MAESTLAQAEAPALLMSPALQTPVLFIIFNRPDVTARVFDAIRQARPPRLYVAADGARANRPAEADQCIETRRIVEQIDWPCELHTLFRDSNLGCKKAVSGAISWFFEHEPEGIVLEDDCLPVPSFFWFCETMLKEYRHDQRVGQITGTCFFQQEGFANVDESYVFSRHGSIWGWASWRRAWQHYDVNLPLWSTMIEPRWLDSAYASPLERKASLRMGKRLVSGNLDAWGYQWTFTKLYHSMLSIVPTRNLILNIGWGAGATHTTFVDPKAPKSTAELKLPLVAPQFVLPDAHYEAVFGKYMFRTLIGQKWASVTARLRDGHYMASLLGNR